MIFELPDIFFGSHPKKEMASQPLQVRQYGFAKNSKKPYHKRIFKKSGDIFFGATSQKILTHMSEDFFIILCFSLLLAPIFKGRKCDDFTHLFIVLL